jgi:hypothetical protein
MTTTLEHLEAMTKQVEKMTALAKANCAANASLKKFYDRLREDYDTEVEARRTAEAALERLREACVERYGSGPVYYRCRLCLGDWYGAAPPRHLRHCALAPAPDDTLAKHEPRLEGISPVHDEILKAVQGEPHMLNAPPGLYEFVTYHDWKTEICPGDCGHADEEECLRLYQARLRAETLMEAASAVEGHTTGQFDGYKATEARQRAADMLRKMAAGGKT